MQNFIQFSLQVRALWTYLFFAFLLAVWGVTTFQSVLGGTQYQSPLLVTLLAVTLTTTITGGIAGGVFAADNTRDPGQVRAAETATYVFVNAASVVTVLVGQLSETWETGWKLRRVETQNAITVILELLPLQPEAFFVAYLAAAAGLATVSLALSVWAALSLFKRTDPSPTDLANVGALSLFLLIIGMLAGTPWAPVEADTRVAMRLYGFSVIVFISVIIFICVLIFSLLMAHAMAKLAAVFAYQSTEAVRSFDSKRFAQQVAIVAWAFFRGTATGTFLAAFVVGCFWILGLLTLDYLKVGTPDFQSRYNEAAFGGIALVFALLPWVIIGALAILIIAAFGKAAMQGLWQVMLFVLAVLCRVLMLFVRSIAQFIASALANAGNSVRFVIDLFWPISEERTGASSDEIDDPKGKNQEAVRSASAAQLPKVEAGKLGLALIGIAVGAWFVVEASQWLLSRSGGGQVAPPIQAAIEEGVAQESELPTLVLEDAIVRGVSLCEVLPGGTQWAEGTEQEFVISLYDCALSDRVEDSGASALVLVSVASLESNSIEERARALRRANALAQWSSFQVPADVTVYVLNLGMALRDDAFGSGWEVFGRILGERPAVGALISPSPEGAVISISDVVSELVQILSQANVVESFTDCDLSIVEISEEGAVTLEPVPNFDCRSP